MSSEWLLYKVRENNNAIRILTLPSSFHCVDCVVHCTGRVFARDFN